MHIIKATATGPVSGAAWRARPAALQKIGARLVTTARGRGPPIFVSRKRPSRPWLCPPCLASRQGTTGPVSQRSSLASLAFQARNEELRVQQGRQPPAMRSRSASPAWMLSPYRPSSAMLPLSGSLATYGLGSNCRTLPVKLNLRRPTSAAAALAARRRPRRSRHRRPAPGR